MNLENCNYLVALDDEALKNCNGGGITIKKVLKDLIPTTIYYPSPDIDL